MAHLHWKGFGVFPFLQRSWLEMSTKFNYQKQMRKQEKRRAKLEFREKKRRLKLKKVKEGI